jgi:uncharacterized radical SAM protein YgiQ
MRTSNEPSPAFLPMSPAEMERLNWDELDVLLVTGDAYVDHPAFGAALLGRWLAAHGWRVGIVAQPRWDSTRDVERLGRPRLFAGVTAGALDSMLAHYTAIRKKRHDDAYTPGGRAGARPNRATLVYTNLVRHAFPGLPVAIGGIEASMRRAVHYDFWSDSVRRSILLDSKADLLVYGMAERALLEVAQRLSDRQSRMRVLDLARAEPAGRTRGTPAALRGIPGTAFVGEERTPGAVELPSYEDIRRDPMQLMVATLAIERQVHATDVWAVQSAQGRITHFAPPAAPLTTREMDALYALPFSRRPHPSYREPIPAVQMVQFSITTHRGCAGGCSFCSLALHQGRRVQSRGEESVLKEAGALTRHAEWRGSLSDVGGPTANMWGAGCGARGRGCRRPSCLFPGICPNFRLDQSASAAMLRRMARVPGVRHVRVASGVRHDLALLDEEYARTLIGEFVGGQLKLAPEHCSARVLRLMRKPPFGTFERFLSVFERCAQGAAKEQYVVPYLVSAFPGCTDDDMRELAAWLGRRGWRPRQVQCFIPTPGTVATAMYHAGVDTEGRPIPVARTDAERLRQHGILLGRV